VGSSTRRIQKGETFCFAPQSTKSQNNRKHPTPTTRTKDEHGIRRQQPGELHDPRPTRPLPPPHVWPRTRVQDEPGEGGTARLPQLGATPLRAELEHLQRTNPDRPGLRRPASQTSLLWRLRLHNVTIHRTHNQSTKVICLGYSWNGSTKKMKHSLQTQHACVFGMAVQNRSTDKGNMIGLFWVHPVWIHSTAK
jgi:hypothetical protein